MIPHRHTFEFWMLTVIGGSWAGRNGVDNDAMPQSFDVEYIHVYQRLKQSTIGVDLMPK